MVILVLQFLLTHHLFQHCVWSLQYAKVSKSTAFAEFSAPKETELKTVVGRYREVSTLDLGSEMSIVELENAEKICFEKAKMISDVWFKEAKQL